jgi:uncharacterized protein (TIGR00661 family)
VPRPQKTDPMGEWILRNYAKASQYIGLHFKTYDDFILPAVIKKEILQAEPVDKGHITVYLPSFSDAVVGQYLHAQSGFRFQVFSKEIKKPVQDGNILFLPVQKESFNKSLIACNGIITNAGFETPAEALYLRKNLLVIPIKGQYEQYCNAAALERIGVASVKTLDQQFSAIFQNWVGERKRRFLPSDHSTESIISFMMHHCTGRKKYELDLIYPELTFN